MTVVECMEKNKSNNINNIKNQKYSQIRPINDKNKENNEKLGKITLTTYQIKNNYNLNCVNKLLGGFLKNINQSPIPNLFYHFYTDFSYLYLSYLLRYNRGLHLENSLNNILLVSDTIPKKRKLIQSISNINKLNDKKNDIINVCSMTDLFIQEYLKKILNFLYPLTYNSIRTYFCNEYFESTICNHFKIPSLDNTKMNTDMTYLVLVYLIIFTFKNKDSDITLTDSRVNNFFNGADNPFFTLLENLFTEFNFNEKYKGSTLDINDQKNFIRGRIFSIYSYMYPPAKINGNLPRIVDTVDANRGTIEDYNTNPSIIIWDQVYFFANANDAGNRTWILSRVYGNYNDNNRLKMNWKLDVLPDGRFYNIKPYVVGEPLDGYTPYTFCYDGTNDRWGWYSSVTNEGVPEGQELSIQTDEGTYFYRYNNYWGWFDINNKKIPQEPRYKNMSRSLNRDRELEPSGNTFLYLQPKYRYIPQKFRMLFILATIVEFLKSGNELNENTQIRSFRRNLFYRDNGYQGRDTGLLTNAGYQLNTPISNANLTQNFPLVSKYMEIIGNYINNIIPTNYDIITKNIINYVREISNQINDYPMQTQ